MRKRLRKRRRPVTRVFGLCMAAGYLFLSCFIDLFHNHPGGRAGAAGEVVCSSCSFDVCRPTCRQGPSAGVAEILTNAEAGKAVSDEHCPACMFLQANHSSQVGLNPPSFQPSPAVAVVIEADELRFDDVGSSSLRIRAPPSFSS